MQSARSVFRRASRRLRRSTRRQGPEEVREADDVSPQQVVEKSDSLNESSSALVETEMGGVTSGIEGNAIAAAAAKLSDLDSSTEDVQGAQPVSNDCIDQLFVKQRRELMYELRTIQNSHRPVSKGDQRRRLERFFRQHLHGDVSDTTSEGSNEDGGSPRRRRNGVVLGELEGLMRQQSVTQRLQCQTFRRDLENMVRGTVVRQEREVEVALRLRTAGLPGNRPHPLIAEGGVGETGSRVSGVSSISSQSGPAAVPAQLSGGIPVPPPLPLALGEYQAPPPLPPFQPPTWQSAARQPTPQQQHQQQGVPQAQQQGRQPDANRWPLPSAPWLVRNSAANGQGTPGRADVLQQYQREAIVTEISELIHRRVVQEAMHSEFRNQLEFLMRNRLTASGTDGERVMNFVNSIPQTQHHRRNDFSHLGIHVPDDQRDAAGASGGAAVPAAFAHEMESLRSRMNELHEMVRMSMEMQLDLQRAIRQEVSAALHQQNGTVPSTASPATTPASEGNCIICLDKEVDAVLYQCGHMCVCLTCGLRLSTMGSHCPMCRAPIRDVIRAYRCQHN